MVYILISHYLLNGNIESKYLIQNSKTNKDMKRIFLFIPLLASITSLAQQPQPAANTYKRPAPSFRLNGYAGYMFSDRFNSYYSNTVYYDGKVNSGFQWGVGLEWMVRPSQGIELTYLREDTHSPTTYADSSIINPIRDIDFNLAVNYIFLGTTRYFKVSPIAEPYFGVQAGMAIISVKNPDNSYSGSGTKFAWGLKGGTNLWVSPRVGIKLQCGLASVTQAVGGELYFSPYGVTTGATSYSTVFQFSLGGGLVFKLGGL